MRRATERWASTARTVNSSDLAAELIRRAILDGTLPAGARLKEDELAVQLEVSRTPVREALRKLAADDLVVLEPKRGARVRKYEAHELDDLYRLRAVLEGYAARRAAERIDNRALDELRGSCSRFARLAARKRVAVADLAAENQVFHDGVLAAAADDRLAAMARSVIHLPLVYKAYIWFSPEDRRASAEFHWQVTEALARGAGNAAARAMERHVQAARDQLLRALAGEEARVA
jgi:DNA-binding GntR family transcriptional regulator